MRIAARSGARASASSSAIGGKPSVAGSCGSGPAIAAVNSAHILDRVRERADRVERRG